ncbi:glycosyltransferase [Actinobacillus equuli]|nr:glycosyltransferase [Actinobacillus equuli]
MNNVCYSPSVAIITSTIGRPHLERAILSVQQQSYTNCKHYVFVDGEQFFTNAKTIVEKYPHVVVTYLPMNTGANGWTNSSINAIAPFWLKKISFVIWTMITGMSQNILKLCSSAYRTPI